MSDGYAHVGHIFMYKVSYLLQVVYAAAHNVGLAVTAHLKVDGIGNYLAAEGRKGSLYGVAVGWGCAHNAHIASAHEREL